MADGPGKQSMVGSTFIALFRDIVCDTATCGGSMLSSRGNVKQVAQFVALFVSTGVIGSCSSSDSSTTEMPENGGRSAGQASGQAAAEQSGGGASEADRFVESIRSTYVERGIAKLGRPGSLGPQLAAARPVLPDSVAQGFDRQGAGIVPRFPSSAAELVRSRLSFPASADAPFTVSDARTGVSVAARLLGARAVVGEISKGYLVYRGALRGGLDLIHVPQPTGTEDWLTIRGPETTSVSYEIGLGEKVAGLRLFTNTLELLDKDGMPRLRVSPPYLVDASSVRHPAKLGLTGCVADSSAAPPWSHSVQPAGATSCTVTVTWDASGLAYPALLDPVWSTTGTMVVARYGHVAGLLNDGTVIAAGGVIGSGASTASIDSAERFTVDAQGVGVWTAAASLKGGARGYPFGVARLNRFFVIGGTADLCSNLNTAEYFSTANNDWTATTLPGSNPPRGRSYDGTATLLGDGRILVVGGTLGNPACDTFTPQVAVDLYSTLNDTWTRGPDLPVARANHTATVLPNSRILMAGGQSARDGQNPAGYLATTVIFNPSLNQWADGPTMNHGRRWHGAGSMNDSTTDVIVFGGPIDETTQVTADYGTTERWTGGSTWTVESPGMLHPRQWNYGIGTTTLPNSSVLAALGNAGSTFGTGEIFSPTTGQWSETDVILGGGRVGSFTLTALGASGKALVAGGQTAGGGPSGATDLYTPPAPPVPDGGPETGVPDAGPDTGAPDVVVQEGGSPDVGSPDVGSPDVGSPDVGTPDVGSPDTGVPDAPVADAQPDATPNPTEGGVDAGRDARADAPVVKPDAEAGVVAPDEAEGGGCGCRVAGASSTPRSGLLAFSLLALARLRHRRRGRRSNA
jgi:hypothetical protein